MKIQLKKTLNKLLSIKRLKKSIFIPFFLFAFVFISISLISIYILHKKVIQKEVSFEYSNIDTMFKDKIKSEAINLRLFVVQLSTNDSLLRAFKNNDRNLFQKASEKYFKKSDLNLAPDLLNFISSDGIVLYRNHQPKVYGQKVTQQFIYKKAVATGASFFHIGSGTYSGVSLKVIVPVRDTTQKVVGYIVVGKDFSKILQETAKQTHMDFLFFTKLNLLNLKLNKDKIKKFGLFKKGNDDLFLEWSTLSPNAVIDKEVIETKIKSNAVTSIRLNGVDYLSKSLPLINFDETEFGQVFVLHDNSIHLNDLMETIAYLILISIVMIVILSLIFNTILNKIGKNLFDKNQKLILELKKRIIAERKLSENISELKQLTLIASHDLRSPLTNLEGLLDLLQNEDTDSDLQSLLLENAATSVELMKNTIDSLTTIVKQRESFLKEIVVEQSIQPVFDQVILQLEHLIKEKHIEIKTNFVACPSLLISQIHLKSILLNLLSNAIKYASETKDVKCVIEVYSVMEKGVRSIVIQDNGIGFDSNFQKGKLFKPFKRFHHEKTGSGIGLYLTKLIVENYNGKIQIESEVGKGTMVKIDF